LLLRSVQEAGKIDRIPGVCTNGISRGMEGPDCEHMANA